MVVISPALRRHVIYALAPMQLGAQPGKLPVI